jgi:hypothetical protein
MNTHELDAANEQWRRHSEDEASARQVQQESAGDSHQPVEGPPPYGNEQVNLMAATIVEQERERCARLVENWPAGPDLHPSGLLHDLAAALRRGL